MVRNAFFNQLAIASGFGFEKMKSIQFVAVCGRKTLHGNAILLYHFATEES